MQFVDRIQQHLGWCPDDRVHPGHRHRDVSAYTLQTTDSPEKPPSADLTRDYRREKYRHTQTGVFLATAMVVGILGTSLDILTHGISGLRIAGVLLFVVMLVLLLMSTTLTVVITDRQVEMYHGPLALRKRRIPLSGILSVRVEKDAQHSVKKAVWYHNPGAELALTLGTGVVIEETGGKTYWIGTDEPEALVEAILSAKGGMDVHS